MSWTSFRAGNSGSAAVEFGLTAPVFFAMIFGLIGLAILIWTQVGIQHAAELAARCASINTVACGTDSKTQAYAATQALGLSVPASAFAVTRPTCGVKVTGTYTVVMVTRYLGFPSVEITGESCYPITPPP